MLLRKTKAAGVVLLAVVNPPTIEVPPEALIVSAVIVLAKLKLTLLPSGELAVLGIIIVAEAIVAARGLIIYCGTLAELVSTVWPLLILPIYRPTTKVPQTSAILVIVVLPNTVRSVKFPTVVTFGCELVFSTP